MTRIGLISDTHSHLPDKVFTHFDKVDEIWHAGDIGDISVIDTLSGFKPVRAVYGNIDDHLVRASYPENLFFQCEEVKIFMTHIAGTPPRYIPRVRPLMDEFRPKLFICGHSHILKIQWVESRQQLHMNPGAAGYKGFHKVQTLVRFSIDGADIKDCEVIELGLRGSTRKK